MPDLKVLKQRRAQVKGQVTRLLTFFNADETRTAAEAIVRVRRLEDLWRNFESIQDEIDTRPFDEDEDDGQRQRDGEAERQVFEENYFRVAAAAQAVIDLQAQKEAQEHREAAIEAEVRAKQNAAALDDTKQSFRRTKPELPVLDLPKFGGDYTQWMFFKDSFETTIHNDEDLAAIRKHQYLVGTLEGEALQVIQGFSISEENYENAWTLLKNTYDNQMLIIETHLDALLEFPDLTKENKADSMRKFVWHIHTHTKSLEALGQPIYQWDTLIIHLAKKKLDFAEQRDWHNIAKNRKKERLPTLEEFLEFLTERYNTWRVLKQNKTKPTTNEKPTTNKKFEKKVSLSATAGACKICESNHPTWKCEELLKLSVPDRMKTVREKRLCVNCLNSGHYANDCRSSACKKCGNRHNTLLHKETQQQATDSDNGEAPVVTCCAQGAGTATEREITPTGSTEPEERAVSIYYSQKTTTRVILSTVRVHAYDAAGKLQVCRALLDPGSQANVITTNFAKKLKLACKSEERPITGIGQAETRAHQSTQLRIKSLQSDFQATLHCVVLPTITELLPQTRIDAKKIILPRDASLADPSFNEPGPIDLLIGAGLYWKCLIGPPRNSIEQHPSLQNTQFGWIIGGEMFDTLPQSSSTCLAITKETLLQQLEKFWTQEEMPEISQLSAEEEECEKQFGTTFRRDSSGRFIVRLPKRSGVKLGNSREFAFKRLIALERRLDKNPDLKIQYSQFMTEYLDQGHMSLVKNNDQLSEHYVLPHQAVVRPDSVTTKLRVVFDGSARTTSNNSLNDKLIAGPNLQRNLFDIMLRFRMHEYVVTADIASMFRQILVDERDRALQQILWRNDSTEPVKKFQLNTVTYGTSCAPYLAIRCLRQLAVDDGNDLPRAAHAVLEDCYMDDVLSGTKTIDEAVELQKQLSQLLKRGQFHLRKWRTNDSRILTHLSEQCKTDELLIMDKEGALKTLGLLWNAKADSLQYRIAVEERQSVTKRQVLSEIAQVFDPLGLIAPLLISGKMIMQRLWLYDLDWDDTIPAELTLEWESYNKALVKANEIQIPRNVIPGNAGDTFDIFGFGDASGKAYGACLYAVSSDRRDVIHSHLICAKTKVSPLKTKSIPRLELEAALLLAKLYDSARKAYSNRVNRVKLWTDSTIVLAWIRTRPNELKTFVANRVAKIQELTENIDWNHVPTDENPADLLSRGVTAEVLEESQLWWHGPHWVASENQMPNKKEEAATEVPERKITAGVLTAREDSDLWSRFSKFTTLQRVFARCRQFKAKALDRKSDNTITIEELDRAKKTILRWMQQETFSEELADLKGEKQVSKRSKLRGLDPFIDEDGLIRVGGRLRHACISLEQKHPIVLSAKHRVTRLILRDEHLRLLHCPPEQLLSSIRQRYWPLSGRREVRKVVKGCVHCFRYRPTTPEVKMGDLPKERVTGLGRPFVTLGVDYAGPLQLRESRRRGRTHVSKGYIAIFTCLSTKAVHIELVSDLTTEAFLAALNRLTARRGICSEIFSDNGTNFVGAARELKEVYEFLKGKNAEIEFHLARQHIKWSFIPPHAPHFGGIWEAAVKVTKRHLYTVTQGRILTFEECSTLLSQIEAIMNSRPLTPLSSDPNDLSALTPSHFLIGDSLTQPAQYDYTGTPENRLTRWQNLQRLRQQFWSRWHEEYLHELQQRKKWTASGSNIELNTLVLIKEDHLPPLQWVLGRITALHPGHDGVVRVVTVKTKSGEFKRPVKKLCPLPSDE